MNENYKAVNPIGTEKQNQLGYVEKAKARMTTDSHCTPDLVLTAAQAAAGVLVGRGNICRVFGTATDLVEFFPSATATATPLTTDNTAIMLGQTVLQIVANDEFVRTTAGVTRIEVTKLS